MKKVQLTQNKFTIVDDGDYEYLNKYNWYVAKSKYSYYAAFDRRNKKINKTIYLHRIIMNCPDGKFIDHINGNGLDNRKENLRICNKSQNSGNSKLRTDNTSGIKGVSWDKRNKKWVVRIKMDGKHKFLGYFSNKYYAKNVYEKVAKGYFGEFYLDGIRKKDIKLDNEINNIKLEKKERLRVTNKSGIKGVNYNKRNKKWVAQIRINKKVRKHLGYYNCIADAKAAYDVAAGNILND